MEARLAMANIADLQDAVQERVEDGQPCHHHLIRAIAALAGDPDANYAIDIIGGVDLGVEAAIQPTPGIRPNKDTEWVARTLTHLYGQLPERG